MLGRHYRVVHKQMGRPLWGPGMVSSGQRGLAIKRQLRPGGGRGGMKMGKKKKKKKKRGKSKRKVAILGWVEPSLHKMPQGQSHHG